MVHTRPPPCAEPARDVFSAAVFRHAALVAQISARRSVLARADVVAARKVATAAVAGAVAPVASSAAIVHPPAVLPEFVARLSVHTHALTFGVAFLPRVLAFAAGDGPVAAIAHNTAVVLLALSFGVADAHVVFTALVGLATVARNVVSAAVFVLSALVPHGRARGAVLCGIHIWVLIVEVSAGVVLAHNVICIPSVRAMCNPTPNALGLGPCYLYEKIEIS